MATLEQEFNDLTEPFNSGGYSLEGGAAFKNGEPPWRRQPSAQMGFVNGLQIVPWRIDFDWPHEVESADGVRRFATGFRSVSFTGPIDMQRELEGSYRDSSQGWVNADRRGIKLGVRDNQVGIITPHSSSGSGRDSVHFPDEATKLVWTLSNLRDQVRPMLFDSILTAHWFPLGTPLLVSNWVTQEMFWFRVVRLERVPDWSSEPIADDLGGGRWREVLRETDGGRWLAQHPYLPPEAFEVLAADSDVRTRELLAANPSLPASPTFWIWALDHLEAFLSNPMLVFLVADDPSLHWLQNIRSLRLKEAVLRQRILDRVNGVEPGGR